MVGSLDTQTISDPLSMIRLPLASVTVSKKLVVCPAGTVAEVGLIVTLLTVETRLTPTGVVCPWETVNGVVDEAIGGEKVSVEENARILAVSAPSGRSVIVTVL